MLLEQTQILSQKLVLTQAMRQSLDCLQLSAPELSDYVQEIALSNPLLDVQLPTYYETQLPSESAPAERERSTYASRIPGTAFLPPMQRIYRISPPF